jgi:hypothetical protein
MSFSMFLHMDHGHQRIQIGMTLTAGRSHQSKSIIGLKINEDAFEIYFDYQDGKNSFKEFRFLSR